MVSDESLSMTDLLLTFGVKLTTNLELTSVCALTNTVLWSEAPSVIVYIYP